jgi:hypothetical protein
MASGRLAGVHGAGRRAFVSERAALTADAASKTTANIATNALPAAD